MRALRITVIVVLTLALGVVGFVQYRRHSSESARQSAREALLSRQNAALSQLTLDAERGELLDFKDILIVVDQGLVQDLLTAVTPMEADIGGGFHVTVNSVEAVFGDGVALVQMTGTASLSDAQVGAEVTVFGSIDAVQIEPVSGILRCNVSILAVEAKDAEALGRNDPVGRLTEALTEGGLDLLLGPLEIPVKLENALDIPAVDSKRLDIQAATLPLSVAARKIKVFGGKLWVFVDAALSNPPAEAKTIP
jgi:hypothetical protein